MVVQKDKFFPHFQPIIDVCSGHIAGYESLARSYNEQGEPISAGWLFGIDDDVEEQKIIDVDRHIRALALEAAAAHTECGLIFINISPVRMRLLGEGATPASIQLIRDLNLDPSRVVIEITEKVGDTALLDRAVKLYRDEGVQIAIDDFGVGGSQVDRLIAYNPDFLKIDMNIFKKAARGGDSANVLLSLADLADRSNCQILCEGVETEQEYHFALECGASKIQGWLFHPALPHFIDPESVKDSVFSYQTSYLQRKRDKIVTSNFAIQKITESLLLIVESFKSGSIDTLDSAYFYQLGILRFFVCDFSGRQVSPNYEFGSERLYADNECCGRNWGHRPYFPLLIALNETVDHRQIVSKSYIDRQSCVLCKTRGFVLDSDRVLFIDTKVFDETLFCEY